jgi:UDP-N-acetylmuramate--alanine ligase
VLHAARESTKGKVIAIVQPHRYTRLKSLFDEFSNCFNDADSVIVAPVYPAGEQPIEGASHLDLVSGLKTRGHRSARAIHNPDELAKLVAEMAEPGDYVMCLGAGNITQWAYALPDQLKQQLGGSA